MKIAFVFVLLSIDFSLDQLAVLPSSFVKCLLMPVLKTAVPVRLAEMESSLKPAMLSE